MSPALPEANVLAMFVASSNSAKGLPSKGRMSTHCGTLKLDTAACQLTRTDHAICEPSVAVWAAARYKLGDRPPAPRVSFQNQWDRFLQPEWSRVLLMFSVGMRSCPCMCYS
jgi:hypothetical protein